MSLPRLTKPGHTPILIRNVPTPILLQTKELAALRGQSVKGFILEIIRKELADAPELRIKH